MSIGGPSQRYCPAGVYEWVEGEERRALPDQRAELRPLQDLRHQGPEPEHQLGHARRAAAGRTTSICENVAVLAPRHRASDRATLPSRALDRQGAAPCPLGRETPFSGLIWRTSPSCRMLRSVEPRFVPTLKCLRPARACPCSCSRSPVRWLARPAASTGSGGDDRSRPTSLEGNFLVGLHRGRGPRHGGRDHLLPRGDQGGSAQPGAAGARLRGVPRQRLDDRRPIRAAERLVVRDPSNNLAQFALGVRDIKERQIRRCPRQDRRRQARPPGGSHRDASHRLGLCGLRRTASGRWRPSTGSRASAPSTSSANTTPP